MPDKLAMRLGAIILAGGRSTRMGRAKDSLPFGDNTLLGRVAGTLAACTSPVVVVARDAAQALPPLPAGTGLVFDEQPGQGPLAGLATGLRHLRDRGALGPHDAALLAACDQPFWTADAVRWLAAQLAAAPQAPLVMPFAGGALQPLAAVYRLAVLPSIDAMLQRGKRAPHDLAALPGARTLTEAELRAFDPALRFLQNVNTPEEYERALREAGPAR